MRPPANRRKNFPGKANNGKGPDSFNEAACEQAEEPEEAERGTRPGTCFNEAACEQAEERLVTSRASHPTECFNEAACEQAEEHVRVRSASGAWSGLQ